MFHHQLKAAFNTAIEKVSSQISSAWPLMPLLLLPLTNKKQN